MNMRSSFIIVSLVCFFVACIRTPQPLPTRAGKPPRSSQPAKPRVFRTQQGKASFYGARFHGKKTAAGERFNQYALTAAHPSLPFGTKVRVTNLSNQKQVVVRINDRGPFSRGRIIDLSRGAAGKIGMITQGVARVKVEALCSPGACPRQAQYRGGRAPS